MRLLAALDVKVLRDALRMRGQLGAIALVLACGIGLFLGMRTTMLALERARADHYARARFADVFAPLVRAPEHVADRLRAIEGVQAVQTRIVADVVLDVPGMADAVTGRLLSLPDGGRPLVNDLHLRDGRLPAAGRGDEAVVLEAFATAHGLRLGDRLVALIDGKHSTLRVVGTALSPEFIYALGPGQVLPDDRRFGVLWLSRKALAHAFDFDGAFSDAVLRVDRHASLPEVLAQVDRVLEDWGGLGSYARADQLSESFLANELQQLSTFGTLVPTMFLIVAAFLLNVVIGRVVAGQREQIAALKAVGYRSTEIGLHYGKLVALVVVAGLCPGLALAAWLGNAMCGMYGAYYRFPELHWSMPSAELVRGAGIAVLAGALGAIGAIRSAIRLPPAEAMRPPSPAVYRATLLERLGLARLVSPATRMVLREIERRPGRAATSILGIAMTTALVVISTFAFGSIRLAMNVQFGLQQREDVTVVLGEPRALGALAELRQLPGVRRAEPFRTVAVRLRHGPRHDDVAITGIPSAATLQAVLDVDLREVTPRGDGIVLPRKLAQRLAVRVGDTVEVEVREGARRKRTVTVSRIAETFIGNTAYLGLAALCRLLGETPSMNGAWLLVDDDALPALHARVKLTPRIAGIAERGHAIAAFRAMVDENLGTSLTINLGFALVMALGVLYNAARITLAERSRELASLRVLGFRRREVTAILLGEIAVLTIVAIPLGLLLGRLGAAGLMDSLDTEQLRLPFVIEPWTYALATLTVLAASAIAGFVAWRRLERIDVIEVLKSRD